MSSKLKDGEVNEDASGKPVKGTRKSERVTKAKKKGVTSPREVKDDEDVSKKNVKGTRKSERVTKKGVTPPREVQQQVEDDAKTNEMEKGMRMHLKSM
ncbi:hypothetical protein BRARA_G00393 [Brassica rapa]|uniref:Uncharacterized protein n=1 Tax=Brassica campestris TaxID=3711 RepID=A0A397YLY5_BRACM|nr:hypothetical protein BRARA_G00393 [Brassica rapa]